VNKSANPAQLGYAAAMARATEYAGRSPHHRSMRKTACKFAQANMDERLIPAYSAVLWKFLLDELHFTHVTRAEARGDRP
jgi:hypothetical protein